MKPRQPAYLSKVPNPAETSVTLARKMRTRCLHPPDCPADFLFLLLPYKERKITYGKTFLYLGVCHRGTPRQDL